MVLTAGAKQFRSVWTRDFCFAAGGLVAAGRPEVVQSTLRAILSKQRADGLLPRLLDDRSWMLRVILGSLGRERPLEKKLKPNYIGEHGAPAIDGNALVAWAASKVEDAAFAKEALPILTRALMYYEGRMKDGLVVQPPFSDWQDSIKARRGRVFFTNLIVWKGLHSAAAVAERAGETGASFRGRAEILRARILAHFWDEATGTFSNIERGGPLSCDGMLFAVAWGFVDAVTAPRIMAALEGARVFTPWGPRCAIPDYSFAARGWITRLAGIPDYHDRLIWLWQSALAVRAWKAVGEPARARLLALEIAAILERDQAAGEVYEPETGLPVKRRFYKSESPFSWGAGMVVEVLSEL